MLPLFSDVQIPDHHEAQEHGKEYGTFMSYTFTTRIVTSVFTFAVVVLVDVNNAKNDDSSKTLPTPSHILH